MASKGFSAALGASLLFGALPAAAADPTPGYPEAVIQWGVQKGESCDDIAKVAYGSSKHVGLLHRYNRIACGAGQALPEGLTLVLPAEVTSIPDAKIRSLRPDVRARPAGGSWVPASTGMPLHSSSSVNTLDEGRADVEFIDRSRIFLAPNTLVVIYGTASRTRVSKTAPALVEVESGEVKAALAALRGCGDAARPCRVESPLADQPSIEVGIAGGGRVSATSRDTVVQRKGDRTTVAVFDGKAGVTSGGKSIDVPLNHGTRFKGAAPPAPPRPLPPAPAWDGGAGPAIALTAGAHGVVTAAWRPVPGAIGYRVEIARDAEMSDLVAREEVPADILSFRGEKMPVGSYSIRVRAIDKEEYLGVGAPRAIHLVGVELDAGEVRPQEITASPYATLRLAPSPALEMAIDDGPFGPIVPRLDLKQRAPRELRLRARGAADATAIPVRPVEVRATIGAARAPGGRALAVNVALSGRGGIDVAQRIAPQLRVRLPPDEAPGRPAASSAPPPIEVPLAPAGGGALAASVPLPAHLADLARAAASPGPLVARIDVVDDRGRILGTADADLSVPAPPPPPAPPRDLPMPIVGAWVPFLSLSPAIDTLWLAPTPPTAAAVGAGTWKSEDGWAAQGQLRATGSLGPVGVDAALRSGAIGGSETTGSSGWLGARVRVLRLGRASLEIAPALRAGVPLATGAAPVRLEPSIAVGGAAGQISWIVDAGARLRTRDDGGAAGAPPSQGFLLAGAAIEPAPWLRMHLALDAHLVHRDAGDKDVLGGFGAGVEAGRAVFGALSLRAGPPADATEGSLAGQLAIGVREDPL